MQSRNILNYLTQFLKKDGIMPVLLLAIFLRLLVMPFLYHPDIKTYNFQSSFLRKGVVDIYDYLDKNKDELPLREDFVYQPLTYFFLGSYQAVAKPFLGEDFDNWLWDASQQSVNTIGFYRYLFILKFPYLVLDLLMGILLYAFIAEEKKARQALTLWLLNPITIVIIYAYGNIDIIPVFLVMLSLLFAQKEKYFSSALILGIGASFKAYPILFLPFLVSKSKGLKNMALTALSGTSVFGFITLPFFLKSLGGSALVSGLTTRIFHPSVYIGFGINLPVVPVLILLMYILSLRIKVKLVDLYTVLLIILLSLINFHIQWILWIMPFVVISLVKNSKAKIALILFVFSAFLIPLLLNDKAMTVSLYSGISYFYSLLPIPFSAIQRYTNASQSIAFLRIWLLFLGFISIWKILGYQKS